MENIILTNNKDLRLVGVKVGVLSTLRFELPLVSASATHVEVIVTSGNVHSAYTATFIDATKRWQCDIAASQFPAVGRQSYEIAYVLDGKQFWDGKGWIDIADATTSGIEPQPRPEPYRYAVVSVNGYGADAQGAVRIPKTFIATDSPTTTEGFMEGDICFNRETGAMWTLCNVQGTLTWVFNYKNYYTKAETEEAIDRVAAYYITYDAAGNPFPTYAALANAQTVYSGGKVRIPTRNDYCVVLADETHQGAEYRYIYAVAEGQTTGSWQPQFPVEGVMTIDQTVIRNSANPVAGGGVWSMLWGALSALPTGFASLYDWCVAQLAGKQPLFTVYATSGTIIKTILTFVKDGSLMKPIEIPTSNTTVNGKPLTDDVTLTGADIAVSDSDATKINAALAGKLDKSGGTMTGEFGVGASVQSNFQVTPEISSPSDYTPPIMWFGDGAGVGIIWRTENGRVEVDVSDISGATYRIAWPSASGTLAFAAPNPTAGNLAALDANGNPTDSTIPAANVATKGNIPYDRITITTGQLQDHAEQKVTLNAATTTLTLPALTDLSGKVSDFGIDVVNGYEVSGTPTAASFSLAGTIGTDYNLIVPDGETWSEMSALAAGEMAIYYFTLSAFQIGDLPTWGVTKQVVTPVPVPVAP